MKQQPTVAIPSSSAYNPFQHFLASRSFDETRPAIPIKIISLDLNSKSCLWARRTASVYSRPVNTENVPESESKQRGSLCRSISGNATLSLNRPHIFASESPDTLWIVKPKPTIPETKNNTALIPPFSPTLSQGSLKCLSALAHDEYLPATTYKPSVSTWQSLPPLPPLSPLVLNLSLTEPTADTMYPSVSAPSGESSTTSSPYCSLSRSLAIRPTSILSLPYLISIKDMREQRRSRPKPLLPPIINDWDVESQNWIEEDCVLSPDSYRKLVNQYHSLATPLQDHWEGEETHTQLIPVPLFWENKHKNLYPRRLEHTPLRTPTIIKRQKTRKETSSLLAPSKMTCPSRSASRHMHDTLANSGDRLRLQLPALAPNETQIVKPAAPHGMQTPPGNHSTPLTDLGDTAFDHSAKKKQLRKTAVIDRQIMHTNHSTTFPHSPSSYQDIPAFPNHFKSSSWSHVLRKARSSLMPRNSTFGLGETKQTVKEKQKEEEMEKMKKRNEMKASIRIVPGLVDIASLYEAEQELRKERL